MKHLIESIDYNCNFNNINKYLFNLRVALFGVAVEDDNHDLALLDELLLDDLGRGVAFFLAVADLDPVRLV